jgi:carbon monoxide dehydrogenase subunit G
MIETEQSLLIEAPIESVWQYVKDIRQWANLFPGCKDCTVINDNDSRWLLKVGAGGLVRIVNVLVHIDKWNGPERVDFSFKLDGDPVEGNGSYVASSSGSQTTAIQLIVRVAGTGAMAPMWEAMSRPLLPQLAKTFASKLKNEIETTARLAPPAAAETPPTSILSAVFKALRNACRNLFGSVPHG